MKNLAHLPIDVIEKDYENQRDSFDSWNRYWRNDRNSDYHKVNDYSPYVHVKRIIKLYLGKSFDEAFSRYCKLVPKYQQRIFLDVFDGRYPDCYIDDDGNIQLNKGDVYIRGRRLMVDRSKKPVKWVSPDAKYELRHKVTGHPKDYFKECLKEVEEIARYGPKKKVDYIKDGYMMGIFIWVVIGVHYQSIINIQQKNQTLKMYW